MRIGLCEICARCQVACKSVNRVAHLDRPLRLQIVILWFAFE